MLRLGARFGKHEVVGGNVDNLNFVLIPIFEIESRYRRTRLRLENIPSVPFSYGDNNAQSTRLGVLNVSLRQALGSSSDSARRSTTSTRTTRAG